MLVFNDFRCTRCGSKDEYFLDNLTKHTSCHKCGGRANKEQSTISFKLEGLTGAFPTASDKWATRRKKHMELEQREARLNGEPLE